MKDYQIVLQIENMLKAPLDIRPMLTRWLEGRKQECPECLGRGWTGYSEISGEQCGVCLGKGWIGADGSQDLTADPFKGEEENS